MGEAVEVDDIGVEQLLQVVLPTVSALAIDIFAARAGAKRPRDHGDRCNRKPRKNGRER